MYPELKPAKVLRADELGHVTAPVYAVSQLKTAWLGHIRIRGYDAALAACTDRSSSNKDTRQHGFDRLCAQVENATLVLVLDKSVAPTSPAYHPVNGQWEVSHHVRNNSARDRLGYQLQALQRQQREQLALQSQNQPSSAEPQSEPATGPGNRVASLGPHVGGAGQSNVASSGERVFWSGRQGANRAAAETYAKKTGGTTLEMTPTGQALEAQGAGIDAWRIASAEFAKGASGQVTAFAGGSRPDSVWQTIEKPLLLQNKNVTSIVIKDSFNTAKTTTIIPRR